MPKQKKRAKRPSGSPATVARKKEERIARDRQRRRRRTIVQISIVALIVAVGGGVLYALNMRESESYDLSEIGNGIPAVVQVHDVTCPVCTELRANVTRIENEFDDSDLLIRVADIRDESGRRFAARYTTARRATLLFIDGDGSLVQVTSGEQSVGELRRLFRRHLEAGTE